MALPRRVGRHALQQLVDRVEERLHLAGHAPATQGPQVVERALRQLLVDGLERLHRVPHHPPDRHREHQCEHQRERQCQDQRFVARLVPLDQRLRHANLTQPGAALDRVHRHPHGMIVDPRVEHPALATSERDRRTGQRGVASQPLAVGVEHDVVGGVRCARAQRLLGLLVQLELHLPVDHVHQVAQRQGPVAQSDVVGIAGALQLAAQVKEQPHRRDQHREEHHPQQEGGLQAVEHHCTEGAAPATSSTR
ncbi:hypothetical protein X551_03356 [Methylibium sp. T29]|nr:hypothetical protein X551_03356 [Methylibium sp. T29]EWS58183.1 hypothetical protein Y694_03923 [Methylibium sp. T29-B]